MSLIKESTRNFIKRSLITIGIAIFIILFFTFIYFAIDLLLLFFAAVLLAVFFRGVGDVVHRYIKLPQTLSVIIAALGLIGIFSLGIWLLAPNVAEQIENLRVLLPETISSFSKRISQYNWGRLIMEQIPSWQSIIDTFTTRPVLARLGGIFSTTLGVLINLGVVLILAIYLAVEPNLYLNGFIKLFPLDRRERVQDILGTMGETLRRWMLGRFLSMLLIGFATTVGLQIFNVPLALTLGLLAALLTFIPNFGPIIAVTPALLFAFVDRPIKALYVLALYFGIQVIESYLITPLIERETVSLPPVLTIIFQLFMGIFIGGLGLVLASPLLAIILVLVKMAYIEDVLGDSVELPENDFISQDEDELLSVVSDEGDEKTEKQN